MGFNSSLSYPRLHEQKMKIKKCMICEKEFQVKETGGGRTGKLRGRVLIRRQVEHTCSRKCARVYERIYRRMQNLREFKKSSRNIKRKVAIPFGKWDKTSDFVLEPVCKSCELDGDECEDCKDHIFIQEVVR